MTNKDIYLHHLHQARVEHTRWLGMVKLLSAGLLDTNKQESELNISEIAFGKWFYEEAMLFRDTSCVNTVCEMESLWTDIHDHFMNIYEVCVTKNKKTLFGIKKTLSERAIRIAAVHYQEIIILSDKLKHSLRIFEKQLNAKGEQEFDLYGAYLAHMKKEEEREMSEIKKQQESSISMSGARGAYFSKEK